MGATRYEELFVLWNEIAPRLEHHGVDIVEPEVGELITSLDMAGVSFTISWLDDELEAMWGAPATAPAYRKTPTEPGAAVNRRPVQIPVARVVPEASAESQEIAKRIHIVLESVADSLAEHETELGELDAVAGNGDHGRVMARGARAAAVAAERAVAEGAGAATTLLRAAEAWSDRAGGSAGALWGSGLRAGASVLSDEEIAPVVAQTAPRAALDAVPPTAMPAWAIRRWSTHSCHSWRVSKPTFSPGCRWERHGSTPPPPPPGRLRPPRR